MTNTSDGDAIHRHILENPADDTHRLVYADWLEENGDPDRAAFVRFQAGGAEATAVTALPAGGGPLIPYTGGGPGLSGAVARGLDVYLSLDLPRPFVVRRGFVERVELPAAAFTEGLARDLFTRHPVTGVRLTDRVPLAIDARPGWPVRARWVREDAEPPATPGVAAATLAEEWFDLLPVVPGRDSGTPDPNPVGEAHRRRLIRAGVRGDYADAEVARTALSAALVNRGRELAGLKPLPRPVTA